MSVYMTEEEQLEAIKKWWHKYSIPITIVLSAILLAVSAYKYWNWHEERLVAQASDAYEHMMVAFANKDSKATRAYAKELITEYSQTVYADAARMVLARILVSRDHFARAQELLEIVAHHSKMKAFKQVARLRIARLLAAEKNYSKALTELKVVEDNAYMPIVNELKGDIFAATGQFNQAILSYKEAITEVRTQGMGNLFLEMKTNELVALNQSQVNNNSTQAA